MFKFHNSLHYVYLFHSLWCWYLKCSRSSSLTPKPWCVYGVNWVNMILTDHTDDAFLIPLGVHLSWVMLIYVSQYVSDMVTYMTQSVHKCVVFYVIGMIYITLYTIRHVTDTSGVTQKLDCVTVIFPESLSLLVMSPESVCVCILCNCHMSRGHHLWNNPFYLYHFPHKPNRHHEIKAGNAFCSGDIEQCIQI